MKSVQTKKKVIEVSGLDVFEKVLELLLQTYINTDDDTRDYIEIELGKVIGQPDIRTLN